MSSNKEWASGLGISEGIDAPELYSRAERLLLGSRLGSRSPVSVGDQGFDERQATLGPPALVSQGLESGAAWKIAFRSGGEAIAKQLRPLEDRRLGESTSVDTDLVEWATSRDDIRSVLIAGCEISWSEQERLQSEGFLVGRIPQMPPEAVNAWATRRAKAERNTVPLSRRALIVAPQTDDFSRTLAANVLEQAQNTLREYRFQVDIVTTEKDITSRQYGLVLLLCHGAEAPELGIPLLPQAMRDTIMAVCRDGALIWHLGCHGAGIPASRRFDGLDLAATSNDLGADQFSAFPASCLEAGATAVIAHLDGTWSGLFENRRVLSDALAWLACGRGTIGKVLECLTHWSNRLGKQAYDQGSRAGQLWLRSIDLAGFVCFGDPSTPLSWR